MLYLELFLLGIVIGSGVSLVLVQHLRQPGQPAAPEGPLPHCPPEPTLNRVVQALRNSLDLDTIFSTATQEFAQLLQLDRVGISQYLPEEACWLSIEEYLCDPDLPSLRGKRIADHLNPIAEQLKRREIVVADDIRMFSDPVNQSIGQQFPGAWLWVPLECQGQIWGCLTGLKLSLPASFAADEIQLARRFADQLAIAIQQAHLYQQVQQLNQELEQRVQERTIALQESEEQFRQLAENINHVFCLEDIDGRVIYTSPSYEKIWGRSIAELYQNPNGWLEAVHPDDRDRVNTQLAALQQQFEGRMEYRIVRPDGKTRWICDRSFPIRNAQGQVYRIAGLSEDITDRKQAEAEIRRSKDLFEAMFEESTDAIFLVDYNTKLILTCNNRAMELFEADSREALTNIHGPSTLHKHPFTPEELAAVRYDLATQGFWQCEIEYQTQKGNIFWGSAASKKIQVSHESMLLVRVTDIGDRKTTEAALKRSEARLKLALNAASTMVWEHDLQTDRLAFLSNRTGELVSGEIHRLERIDLLHPNDHNLTQRALQSAANCRDGLFQLEFQFRADAESTEWRWFQINGTVCLDAVGHPTRILSIAFDINARKQAELRLQQQAEADQLLATIAQTINQSVRLDQVLEACLEKIRQFLQCDRVFVARFETDYQLVIEMEAVSRTDLSLLGHTFNNPGLSAGWFESMRQGKVVAHSDLQIANLPPGVVQFLAQIQVRADVVVAILQADQLWGLLMVNQCDRPRLWQPLEIDLLKQLGLQIGIASQKASLYRQLENQLTQKEVLLKEVHHRVKNNLQVISSVLWMQAQAANQPTVSRALKNTRTRLQAMVLIHETLYQFNDLGQINFHDYIRRLAESVLSAYSTDLDQINLVFDLEPIVFNLATAMPCGLLLNELLTNAIKHGFPAGRKGEICITLKTASPPRKTATSSPILLAPAQYLLIIQDTGVGIPKTLNLKKLKSLGLKIAYDLALQLEGSLELESTEGTHFRLTFAALEYF